MQRCWWSWQKGKTLVGRVGVSAVLAWIAMLWLATGAQAASAAATQAANRFETWFDQLADSDPAVRDEARVNLMGLRRDQLPALRHIVQNNLPLAPSQAAVLRDIVIHIFLAGEPYASNNKMGFLGAMLEEMAPVEEAPDEEGIPRQRDDGVVGVIITEPIEGFCANRFLRAGDIVLGVIGDDFYPTATLDDLRARVQNLKAGEAITLQIMRQAKVIRVTFKVDACPWAAQNMAMDEFRNKRMERAKQYWRDVFEPAVDPVTVPVKGNAPSNPLADT
jgi:hypothetical protein